MKKQFEDLTGKVFERLTVIKFSETRKNYERYWLCLCLCKTKKIVNERGLKYGTTKSCDCLQKEITLKTHTKNYIGLRFGKLIVIEKIGKNKKRGQILRCKCDCGNIKIVHADNLLGKGTKSCGCGRMKDLKGKRFGKLVALEFAGVIKREVYWTCECDCGKLKNVRTGSLRRRLFKTCGCEQYQKGKKHHLWNHNLSKNDRQLLKNGRNIFPENTKFRNEVFKRDNYTCQVTGKKGSRNICAHHLESWHANKDLRFEIFNGITILQSVHKLFHKLYGRKFNTKQQFEEFKKRYNSREFDVNFNEI